MISLMHTIPARMLTRACLPSTVYERWVVRTRLQIRSRCREISVSTWLDEGDRRYNDLRWLSVEILPVPRQEPRFALKAA
ncbi:hypothetical protein [Variovorax sp. VRV01]|uniref:hypothetical protein n=1 Tax=Variovorax sp. VRV01 TaxID=2769259 RepID=UPI001B6A8542|nr:hypothetical protein [Variovorax sp. VRV01]